MNRRLFFIIVLLSILIEAESFLEIWIYDEFAEYDAATIISAYVTFVIYSIAMFTFIFFVDIKIIAYIDKNLPWNRFFYRRVFIEFFTTNLAALFINIPMTIFINNRVIVKYFDLPSDGLLYSVFYNALYMTAINTLFVVSYEVIYLYGERKKIQLEWERAEKENILSQFETLKNQVNPHFLFNSMNSLSALISNNPKKAVQFTKEFSGIFRKMLEINENLVLPLKEELQFVNSFIYLEKIRYGENLKVNINIKADKMNDFVPPFALQILIENAIKHNVISTENPLTICISEESNYVVVKNNLQPRNQKLKSTRVGLDNLTKRYQMICDKNPDFQVNGAFYIARIPIISEEQIS